MTDLLSEAVGVGERLDILRHFGHERAHELHHLQALHEDRCKQQTEHIVSIRRAEKVSMCDESCNVYSRDVLEVISYDERPLLPQTMERQNEAACS